MGQLTKCQQHRFFKPSQKPNNHLHLVPPYKPLCGGMANNINNTWSCDIDMKFIQRMIWRAYWLQLECGIGLRTLESALDCRNWWIDADGRTTEFQNVALPVAWLSRLIWLPLACLAIFTVHSVEEIPEVFGCLKEHSWFTDPP